MLQGAAVFCVWRVTRFGALQPAARLLLAAAHPSPWPPSPSPLLLTSPPFPPALPPAGAFNQDSRYGLAEAQVARAADFGSNDRTSFTRTHLGHLLHPGDTALGYDVANANLVDLELDKYLAAGKVGHLR